MRHFSTDSTFFTLDKTRQKAHAPVRFLQNASFFAKTAFFQKIPKNTRTPQKTYGAIEDRRF